MIGAAQHRAAKAARFQAIYYSGMPKLISTMSVAADARRMIDEKIQAELVLESTALTVVSAARTVAAAKVAANQSPQSAR